MKQTASSHIFIPVAALLFSLITVSSIIYIGMHIYDTNEAPSGREHLTSYLLLGFGIAGLLGVSFTSYVSGKQHEHGAVLHWRHWVHAISEHVKLKNDDEVKKWKGYQNFPILKSKRPTSANLVITTVLAILLLLAIVLVVTPEKMSQTYSSRMLAIVGALTVGFIAFSSVGLVYTNRAMSWSLFTRKQLTSALDPKEESVQVMINTLRRRNVVTHDKINVNAAVREQVKQNLEATQKKLKEYYNKQLEEQFVAKQKAINEDYERSMKALDFGQYEDRTSTKPKQDNVQINLQSILKPKPKLTKPTLRNRGRAARLRR